MAFTAEDLDPSIDFSTHDTANTPQWIEGKGQRVYWRDCSVTVFENRGEGRVLDEREGQGMVPSNVELYFAGEGGKIKQSSIT